MAGIVSLEDRKLLCRFARESIASALERRPPAYPEPTPGCSITGGAFVTIHEQGQLRGCIGRMASADPVYRTVAAMGRAAAFEDPRFDPISPGELPHIKIEITILGPLMPISGPNDIRLGTDGVYIIAQGRSGVLLPQVAVEQGWNQAQFLDHLCAKAGLPPGSWSASGASIYSFEGQVFGEEE